MSTADKNEKYNYDRHNYFWASRSHVTSLCVVASNPCFSVTVWLVLAPLAFEPAVAVLACTLQG